MMTTWGWALYVVVPFLGFMGRVGAFIGYNNELAHWIEAGADMFVMPSLYEPCGLNQMYSLKYGTVPIVRATGGLDDTVQEYNEAAGTGTGFKFWDAYPAALFYTLGWAISTFFDRPAHFANLIQAGMAQDYSWERSAEEYERLTKRQSGINRLFKRRSSALHHTPAGCAI